MRFLLALVLATNLVSAQAPIIGLWQLDESAGLATMDLGPFGNHGTLVNFTNGPAQWVPGQYGNALQFDGVDDHVDIAWSGGLPFFGGRGEAFSVCFWVNGTPTNDVRVLALSSSSSNTPLLTFGTGRTSTASADKLQIFLRDDANITYPQRYSTVSVFDDTWHHVVYTEHAGEAALYVDGVLDPAPVRTFTGDATFTFDRLTLGAIQRISVCCHFTGALDEVQIYGFRLSQADVTAVMAGGFAGTCRASFAEYGNGCGAGPFDLGVAGSPVLGGPGLLFSMRNGLASGGAILMLSAGRPNPLALGAFGFPGCRLYPANPEVVGTTMLNPFGASTSYLPLPIPNLVGLACLPLTLQAVSFAGAGGVTSDAVVAQPGF